MGWGGVGSSAKKLQAEIEDSKIRFAFMAAVCVFVCVCVHGWMDGTCFRLRFFFSDESGERVGWVVGSRGVSREGGGVESTE